MPKIPRLGQKFSKPTLSRYINEDIPAKQLPETPPKTRLDHYLVEHHPEYNRSTIQKFIKDGSVTINGQVITKPSEKIAPSDTVVLNHPAPVILSEAEGSLGEETDRTRSTRDDEPVFVQPTIIYEDNNVLVLDKPSGMLSQSKGNYNPEPTIEDHGLLVHRLDRGTSGVIILAKDEQTRSSLQKQFQQRKTHKTYYAIVEGHPTPDHAIINVPIARNLSRPSTFRPDESGREAVTEYKVLESNGKYSLLELKPTTGRTHQLRVHLAHIGHPILGDTVYGGSEALRIFLHAHSLEITIPGGIRKTFTSPLPQEFTDVFKRP